MTKHPEYKITETYGKQLINNTATKAESLERACEVADHNRKNPQAIITVSLNGYKMAGKDTDEGKWVTIGDIVMASAR